MPNKVRAGTRYRYRPVLIDKCNPPFGALRGLLKIGDTVRVVALHGCPPPNTMGHCHIETEQGDFLGLVHTNSLERI